MERILITPEIKDLAVDYRKVLKQKSSNRFSLPIDRLSRLHSFLVTKVNRYQKYAAYVKEIIDCYDEIICLKPALFENYTEEHFYMLDEDDLKHKFKYRKKKAAFYEHVVEAMRYRWVRDTVFLEFGLALGIKACVYCNAQYATTVLDNGKRFAAYDLDHYYPKSKYPFLSTSFFNLVPVCSHCNRVKSDKSLAFCLYTEDDQRLRPLKFHIGSQSVIDYMMTHNAEGLEISVAATEQTEKEGMDKFIKELGINSLYQAHKNEAGELLWKAKIYNASFRAQLKKSFGGKINLDDSKIDRILYGFEKEKGMVHQRPLTLLGQDILEDYSRDYFI